MVARRWVRNSFFTVFMCWNLGFPATAPVIFIGPKRKTPWERLPKGDRFESLPMLRYRSWPSSIPSRTDIFG